MAVFVFSSCIHPILTNVISRSKVFDRPVLVDDCSLIPAYVTGFNVPDLRGFRVSTPRRRILFMPPVPFHYRRLSKEVRIPAILLVYRDVSPGLSLLIEKRTP